MLLYPLKIIIILSGIILIAGCTTDDSIDPKQCINCDALRYQNEINKCKEWGGIPVLSTWDGRLNNCIFKPKK